MFTLAWDPASFSEQLSEVAITPVFSMWPPVGWLGFPSKSTKVVAARLFKAQYWNMVTLLNSGGQTALEPTQTTSREETACPCSEASCTWVTSGLVGSHAWSLKPSVTIKSWVCERPFLCFPGLAGHREDPRQGAFKVLSSLTTWVLTAGFWQRA